MKAIILNRHENSEIIKITNFLGQISDFQPKTTVHLWYDSENLHLKFEVFDCFVRCTETQTNGKIWEDSCVEFFFAPSLEFPNRYFNLEINCGGTALMHFNTVPRIEFQEITEEDILKFDIKSNLPKVVNPELTEPTVWTIECKLPFEILQRYFSFERPKNGTLWRGNFYKTAKNTSNPHYISWKKLEVERPDFHRPEFFGELIFS